MRIGRYVSQIGYNVWIEISAAWELEKIID